MTRYTQERSEKQNFDECLATFLEMVEHLKRRLILGRGC